MNSANHFIKCIVLSLLLITMGSLGYMTIEGWEFLDALYMTVITFSTVGFKEVHQISPMGQLYTMVLIFIGVGFFLYVAGIVIQFMVEGRMRELMGRRKLDKKIFRLKDHYIVCGYGRIGRVLCKKINHKPFDFVVIEKDPELIPALEEDGMLYVSGDAGDEATLQKAGIERAKGLVAVLATDTDNVFLVLTARQLNAGLTITARAGSQASKNKLRAAGADTVESPYEMGAVRMAQRILRPAVTSFLDQAFADGRTDILMEEIPIRAASKLNNVMLKDSGIRQNYNLIIIAVKLPDGNMQFNPSYETILKADHTVIAVGEEQNLQALARILNPS